MALNVQSTAKVISGRNTSQQTTKQVSLHFSSRHTYFFLPGGKPTQACCSPRANIEKPLFKQGKFSPACCLLSVNLDTLHFTQTSLNIIFSPVVRLGWCKFYRPGQIAHPHCPPPPTPTPIYVSCGKSHRRRIVFAISTFNKY